MQTQNTASQITTPDSKVVELIGPYYGSDNLSTQMGKSIKKNIIDGWLLFSVNVVNAYSPKGTGQPMAYLTFLRDTPSA